MPVMFISGRWFSENDLQFTNQNFGRGRVVSCLSLSQFVFMLFAKVALVDELSEAHELAVAFCSDLL